MEKTVVAFVRFFQVACQILFIGFFQKTRIGYKVINSHLDYVKKCYGILSRKKKKCYTLAMKYWRII